MDTCPTCRAKIDRQTRCRRCGSDLSLPVAVEKSARLEGQKAMAAFQQGNFEGMFFSAKRAAALMATPEAWQMLTWAAVLTGRHALAHRLSGHRSPFQADST